MFGICMPSKSEELLNELVAIQCELFSDLGLSYRLLDMPSEELGAPAYKKYDVETWLPATKHWAEVSVNLLHGFGLCFVVISELGSILRMMIIV